MGMPFYAGWGLTEDTLSTPVRRERVEFKQLAFASLLSYSRYVIPNTSTPCEIETIIELLADAKQSEGSRVNCDDAGGCKAAQS